MTPQPKVTVITHRRLLAELLSRQLPATASLKNAQVAILDPAHPAQDTFDLARQLKRRRPPPAVLYLADKAAAGWIRRSLDVDAAGFLTADCDLADLRRAVSAALRRQKYYSPDAARIVAAFAAGGRDAPAFTRREVDVVNRLAAGDSSKEIARSMGCSPRTIDAIRARLLEKTRARTSAALIRFACAHRYVQFP